MRVLAFAVCMAFLPLPARAQSLAEIAEKEKQKRAASKAPKKVFTEADLQKAGGRGASFPEGTGSEPAPAATETKPQDGADTKPPKTADELRSDKREELQKKLDEQVKLRAGIQKQVDDAQRELNDVNVGYPRRGSLLKLVEDGRKELAKYDGTLAGIEDEARRAGIALSR